MLSLLEVFGLSPTIVLPCLCTPSSHFLDHFSPNSLSQSLITFQNSDRHHPDHPPPPPNTTFLYFSSSCLGPWKHLVQSSTPTFLHSLVETSVQTFMASECELVCEMRMGLCLFSLCLQYLAQFLAQGRC